MKILINALGADVGGAANHLSHFLPALAQIKTENQYWILAREKFADLKLKDDFQFIFQSSKHSKNFFHRFIFENFAIARLIEIHQIDILVSLTNFGPIKPKVPHIVFQRNPLYFSKWYRKNSQGKSKIENLLRAQLVHQIMKNSKKVVTPSHSMEKMILETFPDLQNISFQTLYHGIDIQEPPQPLSFQNMKLFQGEHFKILYPTLAAFHKGIFLLFDTLRSLKLSFSKPFKFYLTFSEQDAIQSYAHLPLPSDWKDLCRHVIFMGNQPQSQMKAIYQSSDLMFYPSLCESFGFSMVEALGAQLPIVAADTPINREICQKSALYFQWNAPDTAAQQIQQVFEQPEIRNTLIEQGQKALLTFDWSWKRYCFEFENICNGLKAPRVAA